MTTYFKGPRGDKTIIKDPDEVLDYPFDWSKWLGVGEAIASRVVTVETGITKDSDALASPIVNVILSGGVINNTYRVECKITTDSTPARVGERSIFIQVEQR